MLYGGKASRSLDDICHRLDAAFLTMVFSLVQWVEHPSQDANLDRRVARFHDA